MGKANEELREKWRGRLREMESSGLSVAEFARRHSLNVKTVYNWRDRLGPKARSTAKPARRVASSPRFVQLQPSQGRSKLELRIGGRYELSLDPDFDVSVVSRLLDVLERRQ